MVHGQSAALSDKFADGSDDEQSDTEVQVQHETEETGRTSTLHLVNKHNIGEDEDMEMRKGSIKVEAEDLDFEQSVTLNQSKHRKTNTVGDQFEESMKLGGRQSRI